MNPKENLMTTLKHNEPEWVPCPSVDGSLRVVFHNLIEYPKDYVFDDWGVEWEVGEEKKGAGFPKEFPLKKPRDIDDFPLPDTERDDLFDEARRKINDIDRSKALILGDNGWGIFERAWLLVGMEKLFIWMYEEPETVKRLLHRIANVKIRISERFLIEMGVDGIRYGDDWGGDEKLLMGPRLWREFIKPEQERLYNICKEYGRIIFQHSDGNIEEIISDLVDMGLDILNPLQPECNNIGEVKSKFEGKLTFHSVISSRNMDIGSPEDVEREVKERINQFSKKGGYILAPGHGLSYPVENLKAFREAAIKYGKIPDKWIGPYDTGRGDVEI